MSAHVSAELLRATLSYGRPLTTEILLTGVWSCPMGTAGGDVEGDDAAPVLLVHGLGHDVWDWGALVARRPVGLQLRYFDLPGFGLADKPPRLLMADLVRAVLDASRACDRPPLVVGSSLGGHVAMLAALQDPSALGGLLLISPGGLERVPLATQAIARSYYSLDALLGRADAELVASSRRIFAQASASREALAARKLSIHRSVQRLEYARPFASIVDDVFRHPVAERLADIRCPVRLLFGAADVVVDPLIGRCAADAAGLPVEVFDGVGHLPMVEAPDRVVQTLARAAAETFAQ